MNKLFLILGLAMALGSASCSPESPKQYTPTKKEKTSSLDDNGDDFQASKVDLLFVIDNSGSMSTFQSNLSANITTFTQAFAAGAGLDWQIGVTTSDGPGFLTGNPKIVTNKTPGAVAALQRNMIVGTNGSVTEKFFDPILNGLSPAALAAHNKGMIRPDASLVIIFLTDAEDQSSSNGKSTFNFLLNLKGGDKAKLLAYGVLIPVGWNAPWDCGRDSGEPFRTTDFLNMFQNGGKNVMNICDVDFGTKLAGLAKDIAKRVSNVILLNRIPEVESIRVVYGPQEVPMDAANGWSYDIQKNAIIIGPNFNWNSQPWGTPFKVYYNSIPVN